MSRQLNLRRWTQMLAVLCLSTVASGAQKSDPKPIDQSPKRPDVAGFAEAYERANEPQMIVICGVVTGGPRAGERNLANFDPEADSDALRRRIEENLLEARVELIEQSSLDAVKRRELNLLAQQDEGRVIEALKEKFDADIAIKVEMQPRGGDAKYRVTVDTLSITRSRKIGTFSFDWEQGDDARSVKAYGDAVSRKVIEQFIKFYAPGDRGGAVMRYTVLLVGIEDNRAIRDASRALERINGVSKVRVRGNTDAGGRKATTLEVQYAGQMFDLATDLEEVASDLLKMRVNGTDSNAGTITLIADNLAPPPVAQRSPCEELFDGSSQTHELFKERYKADGRPRVTILINREVFKGERQNQEHAQNWKFIGPPPGGTSNPLLVTATAENAIADWFKKLDVRIVNADQVRRRVEQAAAKAGGVMKEDELLQLLRDDDVADIVVLGRGGTASGGRGVWYTFEATRMGGDNLGNTRWISEVDGSSAAAVDEAFDNLGHDVTCELALKLMAEWKGNRRVEVTVTGVENANAAYAIMDDIKKGFDGIVSADFGNIDGGKAGGTARFSLEYSSSYEDLARKISQLADDGNARFTVESSTREGLILRATGPGDGDAGSRPKELKSAAREPAPDDSADKANDATNDNTSIEPEDSAAEDDALKASADDADAAKER